VDPAETLFETLVSAFKHSVLPTYKCRAVQFLVFYTCSFDAEFGRSFLGVLLAHMRGSHVHQEARMACAAYVASFVARATFVHRDLVLQTAREMLQWAIDYQAQAVTRLSGQPATLDVHLHGTFYACVQGLLYLTCYKYEVLEGLPLPEPSPSASAIDPSSAGGVDRLPPPLGLEHASFLEQFGAGLHTLLHGPLNPLKFCLEAIVIEFERLAICDVSELITANERVVVASHTVGGGRNQLEDFFPFDPLHGFKRMAAIIAPLYQEWRHRGGADSAPRYSNLSALSWSADEEVLSHSLQGMSVTPGSADHALMAGPMGEHMRRRLHENRALLTTMLGGAPVHQAGFSPEYHGARAGRPEQIAPLSLPA